METRERIARLYSDWLSTQNESKIAQVEYLLQSSTKVSSQFDKVISEMGTDGETLQAIFEETYTEFDDNKYRAKREVAQAILEAKDGVVETTIGTSYFPVADRSKSMESDIDTTDRDIFIQIRHAIAGGNMEIAKELIKNSWGKLRMKERLGIIEFASNFGQYGISDGPTRNKTAVVKLKKETEAKAITKDDFAEKVTMTALKNMKIS